jgi:methylmalonyl-CoA mutase C-terminal domain/subunit
MAATERERPIRVLVAKVGLDGHTRGAQVIARAFRDAGFEVIYTGLHRTPEEVVRTAVQEDVDVVGVSILTGGEHVHVPEIVDGLDEAGVLDDTLVVVGGVVSDADALREAGVAAVFGPGTSMSEAVEFVREHAPRRTQG